MWNYLYALWRSVRRRRMKEEPVAPRAGDDLRDELHRLLEERASLMQTAASYLEFGYDDLAGRIRDRIAALDRKIGEVRLRLRRRTTATGR
jgi:hypothetical protein